jgi:trk system potassium uptake protein TrkA
MHVIIAGCGRVGSQLAQSLSYEGHDVVVIDKNPAAFNRLGGTFNGITLTGMAFDGELLEEAGIYKAGAFAAVTNYDNTNLMTAEIAANIYEVPIVVARLYNPDKRQTFHKLGIDYICGTTLVAERMKEKLLQGRVIIHQERLDLGMQVVELTVNKNAGGKTIGDLYDRANTKLLTVFRDNKNLEWTDDTPLLAGDRLVVALKREGWGMVLELIGKDNIFQLR